jgi:CRP-like cAMP-binding protein
MHILIKKLETLHSLSDDEKAALVGALSAPIAVQRGADIVRDGSTPDYSTVLLTGIACRYKDLPDGRRQILSFQYPGDLFDLHSYVLKRMDHATRAVSKCTIARLPHAAIEELCARYPNLQYALWRDTMVDTAISNMWIVNTGRRTATERLAHFICEQFVRMDAVGMVPSGRPIVFPVTQTDVADATGLSLVHVNKRLQTLRDDGLIGRNPQHLEIPDWEGLKALAGFDPAYLHYKTFGSDDVPGREKPSVADGALSRTRNESKDRV